MRILAVDDDPIILDLLRGALRTEDNYHLTCCTSAEEATDIMHADGAAFDCFLLDIMLPGVDGIELCARVRSSEKYRATPVIMITASKEPGLMGRAYAAGATDFISKPLNGVELGARINTAGMLNDSLQREREAQRTVEDLTAKMKLRFDETIALETEGVTDLTGLENDLLRLPEGCFAMTLFALDVTGAEDMFQTVSSRAFRRQLDQVAEAMTRQMGGTPWKLAYAGGGRFAGVMMTRRRSNLELMQAEVQAKLALDWDVFASETTTVPQLRLTSLSDQRLWSGRSAGDHLREALADLPMSQPVEPLPMPVAAHEESYAIAAE